MGISCVAQLHTPTTFKLKSQSKNCRFTIKLPLPDKWVLLSC